jgi:hypothetical protein
MAVTDGDREDLIDQLTGLDGSVILRVAAVHPRFVPVMQFKTTAKRLIMLSTGARTWLSTVNGNGRIRCITWAPSHSVAHAPSPKIPMCAA